MKTDDFFEALSDIDDELIANARPVRSPDEIVVRRTPLWKTISGYAAAAACVAALLVGGIFGIKYFNSRNEVTPPASGSSGGVSIPTTTNCMAYTPAEYPAEAKYVYKGDYGELDYSYAISVDAEVYSSYKELAALSDLIVSGQFTHLAHQTADPDLPYASSEEMSFDTFYIDQVVKGDKKSGDAIAIGQFCSVHEGMIYSGSMAPMVCGDRWIYFLEERDGYYTPVSEVQGRYPLPFNQNKVLKECGDYGYYGNNNRIFYQSAVYLQTLNEFGLAVTQDFDGVILSVMTDKNSYKQGEEIKVTATVLNTTDKSIGLLMPCQGENSHTEISTRIKRAERYLPDISVSGVFATAMDSHIVEPGGEYVQEMTFGTFYHYYENREDAMSGTYRGTAGISLLAEPNDTGSETTHHKIDFEIEITGNKNIQPPVETIVEYYGGQIGLDSIKFTMPEFPGTEFEFIKSQGVFADGEQLFGGYPVYSVYLCDLNGDGKREIISCCRGTDYKYLESDVIKVCDYADGGKLYRFADDPFFYDDHLTLKDGSLIVVRTTKPGYSTEPEDILQPLTFDRLEAYYVHPENAPAPVENYDRLDDLSRNGSENSRLFYLEYYCENENEPVYSTVNGTVYDVGYSNALGNCIVVIGDDGCFYCFGSMKTAEPFVVIGDKVTAGQQIGIVGNTGDWSYGTVGVRYFCSLGDIIIKHVD